MSLFSSEGVFPKKNIRKIVTFFRKFLSRVTGEGLSLSGITKVFHGNFRINFDFALSIWWWWGKKKFLFLFNFRQCKTKKAKFSQVEGILRHTSPLKYIKIRTTLNPVPNVQKKKEGRERRTEKEKRKKLPPPPFPPFSHGGFEKRESRICLPFASPSKRREKTAIAPRLKEGRFDVREDYYFVRV